MWRSRSPPSLDLWCDRRGAEQRLARQPFKEGRLANWSRRAWAVVPGGGGRLLQIQRHARRNLTATPASNNPGRGRRSSLSNFDMPFGGCVCRGGRICFCSRFPYRAGQLVALRGSHGTCRGGACWQRRCVSSATRGGTAQGVREPGVDVVLQKATLGGDTLAVRAAVSSESSRPPRSRSSGQPWFGLARHWSEVEARKGRAGRGDGAGRTLVRVSSVQPTQRLGYGELLRVRWPMLRRVAFRSRGRRYALIWAGILEGPLLGMRSRRRPEGECSISP